MLELRERDFKSFFVAPEHAYGKDSPFVSIFDADLKRLLDPTQNPLLKHFGALTFFTAVISPHGNALMATRPGEGIATTAASAFCGTGLSLSGW